MGKSLFCLVSACLVVLLGCGPISRDPACECSGEVPYWCDCVRTTTTTKAKDGPTDEAQSPLTFAATRVYSISSAYYGTGGCVHGSIATDASARCNSVAETVLARLPTAGCAVSAASLTFQRTEWQASPVLEVHRILRPVVDPPAGLSSPCSDPYAGAKWDNTGTVPWSVLGAKGWGTDASNEKATVTIPSTGSALVTVDLAIAGGTVIDGCAATGECVLGLYASSHVWEASGTFSLSVTCGGPPPVCGDGIVAGAETCDDGNAAAGDGCSAACAVEAGWSCAGAPSVCHITCGDGIPAGAEGCDDHNTVSGDGCSSTCVVETGFVCSGVPSACSCAGSLTKSCTCQ